MLYGSQSWSPCISSKDKERLQVMQNWAANTYFGRDKYDHNGDCLTKLEWVSTEDLLALKIGFI